MPSKKVLLLILSVSFLIGMIALQACVNQGDEISRSGATRVMPYEVPKNAEGRTTEQQNIWDRNRVTLDPAKVMWIHLIALDGTILKRMPVRNKVTSSGKRLEPIGAAPSSSGYPTFSVGGETFDTNEFLQADGTYGISDPYIYWFDPMGRYHQWGTAGGLGYLLTDYPIDLANPIDEITGLYNAHVAASKWQTEQEDKLRAEEDRKKRENPSQEPNFGGR